MNVEKPIKSLAIIRLAEILIKIPLGHQVSVLLWQTFFSLWFEKSVKPGITFHRIFGFHFIDFQTLESIVSKLRSPLELDGLDLPRRRLFKAMDLWIQRKDLIASRISAVLELPCPELLHSCLNGGLFDGGSSAWWVDLLHTDKADTNSSIAANFEVAWNVSASRELLPVGENMLKIDFSNHQGKEFVNSMTNIYQEFTSSIEELQNKARIHSAFLKEHEENDGAYLDNLYQLYKCNLVPATATKKCGGECIGAVFTYRKQICEIDPIKSAEIAVSFGKLTVLLQTEFVDDVMIKTSLNLELCVNKLIEEGSKASKTALLCFHDCMKLLELGIEAFPPAGEIVVETVTKLGMSFVKGSKTETALIFQKILKGNNVEVLSRIFQAEEDSFRESFNMVVCSLRGDKLALILPRFLVPSLVQQLSDGGQDYFDLYSDLLNALLVHGDDQVGFNALAIFLKSVIDNRPSSSLNQLISNIFAVIASGKMNPKIFR